MSEAKHTPGPWLIAGEDATFVYALGPVLKSNIFWAHVQAAGPERASREECKANARLIAAAPELLAALEKVWSEGVIPDGFALLQDQVCDAIAKATGSAS
jgi:hypothetical protein